jgi:hypothetical protein
MLTKIILEPRFVDDVAFNAGGNGLRLTPSSRRGRG